MKAAFVILFALSIAAGFAQSAPVVSNVTASQRSDGSRIVDVHYDLFDADGELCSVYLRVSANNGSSYDIVPSQGFVSGDSGEGIASGANKHIVWLAGDEGYRLDGNMYRFRVTADDGSSPSIPADFVLVQGGTFHNGTSNITVSSFYISKYEVTQGEYQTLMGENPSQNYGIGSNLPVYRVSWFNAIEFCNRRSLQEELTPCYSYAGSGTNPDNWPANWNQYDENHYNIICDWSAPGYRLPTEMEWMFAALGGNSSQNFIYSGSNDLNQVGWYVENSGMLTHIVGTKSANELGLHDMSGNVWEWVWDIWNTDYIPGDQTDPHGPTNGLWRVSRGGSYSTQAQYCTSAFHNCGGHATYVYYNVGFRLCRIVP